MRSKLYNQFICSSLMLPEHREALTEYHVEERQQAERYVPERDEQELEIWEYLIRESLVKGCKVNVTYMSHSGRRNTVAGPVKETENSTLRIKDEVTNSIKTINVSKVIAVKQA